MVAVVGEARGAGPAGPLEPLGGVAGPRPARAPPSGPPVAQRVEASLAPPLPRAAVDKRPSPRPPGPGPKPPDARKAAVRAVAAVTGVAALTRKPTRKRGPAGVGKGPRVAPPHRPEAAPKPVRREPRTAARPPLDDGVLIRPMPCGPLRKVGEPAETKALVPLIMPPRPIINPLVAPLIIKALRPQRRVPLGKPIKGASRGEARLLTIKRPPAVLQKAAPAGVARALRGGPPAPAPLKRGEGAALAPAVAPRSGPRPPPGGPATAVMAQPVPGGVRPRPLPGRVP